MAYIPLIMYVQPPPVNKNDLDTYLVQVQKTIRTNYSMLSGAFILLMLGLTIFMEPELLNNLYTLRNLSSPLYPSAFGLLGLISNVVLLVYTNTTKNYLNEELVDELKKIESETVTVPPYGIVDKKLMKYYSINALITIGAVVLMILLPFLFHPNFPNL